MVVVDAGAIGPLVRMLSSTSEHNVDQAVWALANLAGEPSLCSLLLESGILPKILPLTDVSVKYILNSVFVISVLRQQMNQEQLALFETPCGLSRI